MMLVKSFLLTCFIFFGQVGISCADQIFVSSDSDDMDRFQEAFILAKPGDEIVLPSGFYEIADGLSIDVDDVIVSGAGLNKTILSFKKQLTGAQGLIVTSDNVTLRDFAIEDAKGDAIKAKGSDGIYFINIRTEWTGGPRSTNGAYGLYPVESRDVLIDGCVAIGASDAGIYVGQSENIIVRNSRAEDNVAGIEIENSYYADVYNNVTTHNSGGILIFDLPDLPQQGGHHVRVFGNQVIDNNTDNFAPEGSIVGEVPRGTGIIIMAISDVEIFDNDILNNGTINLAIVSFSESNQKIYSGALDREKGKSRYTNENYYPHPKSIQIHSNRFDSSGFNPDIEKEMAGILAEVANGEMPDIFWDGILPISQMVFGQPEGEKLVLGDNSNASFLAIRPIRIMLSIPNPITRNQNPYKDEIKPLRGISIKLPKGIFE